MYADRYTESMTFAISETNRRRELQTRHNVEHDITPYSIVKDIRDITERVRKTETVLADEGEPFGAEMGLPKDELTRIVKDLERQMKRAARELEFETAAQLRDQIGDLRKLLAEAGDG